ncbi:MAG TPA: M13 family metallopeptidase [Thermoanaerobaculia bacterium]|nr:M13 family metallopeptidase [Thermoanaerobaculia bacterium]
MRFAKTLTCLVALLAAALAPGVPRKGIELSDMDRSVDPCADFYDFANGAWRAANPIPASMSRWSRRWEAGEASKERLKEILEEASAAKDRPRGSVEQLIGDFYGACMDEAQADRLGVRPLDPLLAEIDGMKNAADVRALISRLHGIAVRVPFALFGGSDNHNPNDVIAQIVANGLAMPDRDYYLKTEPRFQEAREKYRAHVASIFRLAGESEARAKSAADTVMRMETRLAKSSLDNVALRDPKATDHKMSFSDLQKLTPAFDWTAYSRRIGLTRDAPASEAPAKVGDVNVAEPKFLAEFNRQMTAFPIADWKIYLKWHLLNSAAPSLSEAFVKEDFAFNGAYLSGRKEMKPRWKRCAESTDGLLGEALGRKYVERYFPPEAKVRMQELVQNLRTAMRETIEGLDWMSVETKQRALEKLSTFNPKIGYPDKWKDYSKVAVSRGSYWDDVVAGRRFSVVDNLATIGKPVDRGRWGLTPPTSDAYYNPLLNEIVFPAGILQPPAFDLNANDAFNYGAIGVVIGHEISHGFDDEGAQYDAQGRLNNWWTAEDLKKFQEKGACVVKQFDGYFVEPGLHHNGKLVLGESIGDLAGARIAYRAFQISQRGKPPLPAVGGFTPEQQFFIAWGQFRGDSIRPEAARTMVQGDPHPIAKYRVIGPLSNLPEFQKAFSCKPDSPMVRPANERCEVW